MLAVATVGCKPVILSALAVLATLLATGGTLHADIVSFNLRGGGTAMSLTETAGAPGASAADWNDVNNNVSGESLAAGTIVDNSDTVVSGMTMTGTAPQFLNSYAGSSTGNGASDMFTGAYDLNGGSDMLHLAVTNIPYSYYNVYVYTYNANSSRGGNVWCDGENTGLLQSIRGMGAATSYVQASSSTAFNSSTTPQGTYVEFTGLTASTLTLDFDVATRFPISGFQIVQASSPGPATAYWKGSLSGSWSTGGGGSASNWATDASGGTDTLQTPGTSTNVYFSVTGGGSNLNTTLGADFSINSLNFTAAADASHQVTIGGTNTLTIGSGGVTVANGAGTQTISTGEVLLGTAQTWTNNSANAFTVTAPVSGSNLSIAGSGVVVLASSTANTYGTTTIQSGGLLQIGNGGNAGTLGSGAVSNSGTLTFNRNDSALAVSNAISGTGGVLQLGVGTTTLSAAKTYTGGTTVNNGTLTLSNAGITIVGSLTIGPSGTVTATTDTLGYSSSRLSAMNINGGLFTATVADMNVNLTFNMTGGTFQTTSSSVVDLLGNNSAPVAVNTLASGTTAVFATSNEFRLRADTGETNLVFTVAAGSTPSGIDLLVPSQIGAYGTAGITKAGAGLMALTAQTPTTRRPLSAAARCKSVPAA